MRINDTQRLLINDATLASSKKASEVKHANVNSAASTVALPSESTKDKLVISRSSISVATLKQALIDLPDTREERIAVLKAKIASGTYNPTGEEIAKKIVDDAFSNKI